MHAGLLLSGLVPLSGVLLGPSLEHELVLGIRVEHVHLELEWHKGDSVVLACLAKAAYLF